VTHVVGRGPSPFPAQVGPVPHLASVRPRWGCSGRCAGCGSGRLVGLSDGGKRREGYGGAHGNQGDRLSSPLTKSCAADSVV
jgi:hypothetical protein